MRAGAVDDPRDAKAEAETDDGSVEAPRVLDFSGSRLLDPLPEFPADVEPPEAPEALLVSHCFGEAAHLLPADDVAMRFALEAIRAHHRIAGRPKRRHLLVCLGAGEHLPPALATDAEVSHVPDDIGAIRAEIGPRTAGILVSPVRLSSGLEMLPGSFLADLREAADEYGIVLAFDETDGGLGRTGMAFAHEWTGVTPDLMLIGAEAGLGLAVLVMTAKLARALPSPVPEVAAEARATAARVVAQAFAPGFEGQVQELGWQLEDRLAALRYRHAELFEGYLGTGLMQGLVCKVPAAELADRLSAVGLLVRPVGNVLAVLPPLTVEAGDISAAADLLERMVAEFDAVPAQA